MTSLKQWEKVPVEKEDENSPDVSTKKKENKDYLCYERAFNWGGP